MAKKKTAFKPKITKRINNLSRAINKIDPGLKNKVSVGAFTITEIQPRINDVVYVKDGVERKVRYDQINQLSQTEQASLLQRLSIDRYELRQERALEQLKEKGSISWQFKKSLKEDNPNLLESILEIEEVLEGSTKEAIAEEFGGLDIIAGEDFFEEAESFFQTSGGTPELFDFYRPGEAGGFTELNAFTWNSYKVLKGI